MGVVIAWKNARQRIARHGSVEILGEIADMVEACPIVRRHDSDDVAFQRRSDKTVVVGDGVADSEAFRHVELPISRFEAGKDPSKNFRFGLLRGGCVP